MVLHGPCVGFSKPVLEVGFDGTLIFRLCRFEKSITPSTPKSFDLIPSTAPFSAVLDHSPCCGAGIWPWRNGRHILSTPNAGDPGVTGRRRASAATEGKSPPDREKRTVRNFGAVYCIVCSMFYRYIYKKPLRLQIELFYQL